MNVLPDGFYGNYPDQGILEIGGNAGNSSEDTVPEMSLECDDRLILTIRFEEDIHQLKDAVFLGRVGYSITIRTEDGVETEETLSADLRLESFFERNGNGDYDCPERGQQFDSFMKYFDNEKAFSLTFNFRKEWKLISIHFYYSDVPAKIENVSLYQNIYPQEEVFSAKYNGIACDGQYTRNVGKNPVYEMQSQYGTVYSKDFLVSSFLARDESLSKGTHPEIEDPDDYFNRGASASVGRRFVVYLVAKDSFGNESRVTLKLVVVDTRGPNVILLDSMGILSSYSADLSSDDFVSKHFLVRDNYDPHPSVEVVLQNGKPIPDREIGVFDARLVATDSFGNENGIDFSLELIDDIPPEIRSQGDEIVLRRGMTYSREKLLSLFSAYDEIDGELGVTVTKDTYMGNEDKVGEYAFAVKAVDRSGNIGEKEIHILVEDSEGPTFYVRESFLTVVEGEVPTLTDVVEALIRQDVLENKVYPTMKIVEGRDLDNRLEVGMHRMMLYLVDESGKEDFISLTIEVVPKEKIEDPLTRPLSFWERFCQFWIDLWNKIISFFTGGD